MVKIETLAQVQDRLEAFWSERPEYTAMSIFEDSGLHTLGRAVIVKDGDAKSWFEAGNAVIVDSSVMGIPIGSQRAVIAEVSNVHTRETTTWAELIQYVRDARARLSHCGTGAAAARFGRVIINDVFDHMVIAPGEMVNGRPRHVLRYRRAA